MAKNILNKLKESAISVIPIAIVVLILGFTISPLSSYDIIKFIISTILLIFGMALFGVGADSAMFTIGTSIGGNLSKSRKFFMLLILAFLLGFIITLAEPDLSVLAGQVISINKWLFILVVSLGVGLFLALAVLRIIFQVKLNILLIISYLIVFVLMIFTPSGYLPVSIDAGAVTTGPISVPFIMAFGMGISAVRSGKPDENDSFGIIALTSVGPLITTQLLCIIAGNNIEASNSIITQTSTGTVSTMLAEFGLEFLINLKEIILVLLPIVIFFFIYNAFFLKYPKSQIIKIIIGLSYAYFGIVIFLTGVLTGFLPVASILGYNIASGEYSWLLFPIAGIIGLLIVMAEPAVHVLNKKVEDITHGIISKKVMMISISIGVSLSLIISILRVIFNIPFIWLIVPLYIITLICSSLCTPIFTAIAFDSGGVASGTMATSFILPFVMGICEAKGLNIMSGAFGTIAFIACLPILTISVLGLIYRIISNYQKQKDKPKMKTPVVIVEFDCGDDEWWKNKKLIHLLKLW